MFVSCSNRSLHVKSWLNTFRYFIQQYCSLGCLMPTSAVFQGVRFMVFNATFNNISVILCPSALMVEDTRVPRENHRPDASH